MDAVFIYGLGSCIVKAINISLELEDMFSDLKMEIETFTEELYCKENEELKTKNKSGISIKIIKLTKL